MKDKLSICRFIDIPVYYKKPRAGYLYRKTLPDIVFFIIVAAIPTSLFALVNEKTFYVAGLFDLYLLSWLITLPYFLFHRNNLSRINQVPGINQLFAVIFFIALVFLSTMLRGKSFTETFTVFRMAYFTPISCLALLLFFYSMDLYRMQRFFKWLVIAMTIQGFFYIIALTLGISPFSATVHSEYFFEGAVIQKYNLAYPMFNMLVFMFSLANLMYGKKNNAWMVALIISITCMFLSSYRHTLFQFIIFFGVFYFLSRRRAGGKKISASKIFITIAICLVISSVLFSSYIDFFFYRLSELFVSGDVNPLNALNFYFRLTLIEDAINYSLNAGTLLLGNGYVRFSTPGSYDLALGGDTHVAPVLFTEGILGTIVRMLPVFLLLFKNYKEYSNRKNNKFIAFNIIAVSLIVSELFNIIQTPVYRHYNLILLFLFALEIFKFKYKQNELTVNDEQPANTLDNKQL